jgi:hypothetical protein
VGIHLLLHNISIAAAGASTIHQLLAQELLQLINCWRRSFSNSSLAARVSTISVSIIAEGAYTNLGLGKSSQYVHLICMYVLVVITLSSSTYKKNLSRMMRMQIHVWWSLAFFLQRTSSSESLACLHPAPCTSTDHS